MTPALQGFYEDQIKVYIQRVQNILTVLIKYYYYYYFCHFASCLRQGGAEPPDEFDKDIH